MTPDEPAAPAQATAGDESQAVRQQTGPPTRGRAGLALAVVALVLALIALAGAGATGWAWYQLRGEQTRIAELEGRVSALDGRVASLAASAAQARNLEALANRLDQFQHAEQQRAQAFEQSLHALAARLAGGGIAYREDEAEALMRLAQARIELAADPDGAAKALQLADQALATPDEPALVPVRTALAAEIQALQAVVRPDVTGAFARIGAIAARVDSLPLAGDRLAPAPAAATGQAPGLSWSGLGAALKRAFSPLIVVRQGPVARPLLPPREAYFVRANVKLALNGARLALLERDQSAYRASLQQARAWLAEWFATSTPAVASVKSALDDLASLELRPKLPQLGGALARLRALRRGAHAQ